VPRHGERDYLFSCLAERTKGRTPRPRAKREYTPAHAARIAAMPSTCLANDVGIVTNRGRHSQPRRPRHSAACRAGDRGNTSNVSVAAYRKAAWRSLRYGLPGARDGRLRPSSPRGPCEATIPSCVPRFRHRHCAAGGVTRWLHQDMSDKSLSSFMPTIELWRQEGGTASERFASPATSVIVGTAQWRGQRRQPMAEVTR
jgi:hypothetical protein